MTITEDDFPQFRKACKHHVLVDVYHGMHECWIHGEADWKFCEWKECDFLK